MLPQTYNDARDQVDQACVVTVAITALRIASSIVVYTLASMIVATTLWTIVELLWYFLTASWNGNESRFACGRNAWVAAQEAAGRGGDWYEAM